MAIKMTLSSGAAVAVFIFAGGMSLAQRPADQVAASFDTEPTVGEVLTDAGAMADLLALYRRPIEIPYPEDNPFSVEKYELGRRLFFDPRLSLSGFISCATCHNPAFSWEDGMPLGLGHEFQRLPRSTPTILNLAWGDKFFWDGRADSLEEQAPGPMQAAGEMAQPLEQLVPRIASIGGYQPMFEAAFPGEDITIEAIAKAIATFERNIVSGEAPFDRWIQGDETAISDSAQRGFVVFNTTGNCAVCHEGWRFTDDGFHDIGLPDDDLGRGGLFPENLALQHTFKTPTLRNVRERATYMHDGSLATLAAVIEHYDHAFVRRDSLSPLMEELNLSEQDKEDLIAFLLTLSSEDEAVAAPILPH